VSKPCEIELNSGQTIYLKEINQSFTYEGLLEGLPTTEMNRRKIDMAVKRAETLWSCGAYLIEPKETRIKFYRKYPFGTPASIPGIMCLARFQSESTARDVLKDYSALAVVWFQNQFALPIEKSVIARIQEIAWGEVAFDYRI
jgi:hypothetical protein